jgi:TfoX/Sxy family transcriptional regulator of competence genes
MAEYVAVPEELLDDTSGLLTWFERSHDWIGTLKPKPTRR